MDIYIIVENGWIKSDSLVEVICLPKIIAELSTPSGGRVVSQYSRRV